ncbi:MAG TPA: hypothetical protein PLX56_02915 [bacterium]|nr:hypothetical protein [bacterium]
MKKNILSFLTLFVFITSMSAKEKSFPVISDEFRLGELSYTTEYYGGNNVKVGFDGTNYLVLWEYENYLYGSLINQDGVILENKTFNYELLSYVTASWDEFTQLLFNGEKFFFLWKSETDIDSVFISTKGECIAFSEKNTVKNVINQSSYPFSVDHDGAGYIILVNRSVDAYYSDLIGIRLDDSGKEIRTDTILFNIPRTVTQPIVFNGENYFTVWLGDGVSHSGFLSPDAQLDDSSIKDISEIDLPFFPVKILFDGTDYLLIGITPVQEGHDYNNNEISVMKILSDGRTTDQDVLKIGIIPKYTDFHASFDGESYNFFLNDIEDLSDCGEYEDRVIWVKVNKNGEIVSRNCVSSYKELPYNFSVGAAYNGDDILLAYENKGSYGNLISALLFSSDKDIQEKNQTIVTRRQSSQYDLDIAFDGTNYMAVWVEDTDDVEKIYGDIINESGKSLLETPFLISSGEINESQPSVAFNGNEYMVAWDQEKKIFGKRITTEGEIINSDTLIFNENAASSPEIVSDGSGYFLTWIKSYANSEEKMIFGMKISEKGEPLNPYPIEISESSSNYSKPEMIFDGENFFLVWMDNKNYVVFGKRISKNGLVLDNEDIPIVRGVPDNPKVIYNGEKYVVFSKSAEYIIIKTIEKDGSVNTEVKTVIDGIEKDFDVVYDGTNYLVVYGDYGDEYGTFKSIVLSEKFDLIVEPFDISEPFYKINELFSPAKFKTISGKNGTSLVFYTIYSSVNQYSTDQRIFYRSVTSSELGSPCADESFCRSGFCVDSVCCESASCDDGNPDTEDSCSNTGKCVYEIISIESDDSNNSDSGCGCTIIF